jgi:quercetin dioxygenase-like cupin family protein
MAEILSVDLNSLFQGSQGASRSVVFRGRDAAGVRFKHISEDLLRARMLTPLDLEAKASAYLLEIPQGKTLPSHFLLHKGEEFGYLLEGELRVRFSNESHLIEAGDIVYLTSDTPSEWANEGKKTAILLWLTIR